MAILITAATALEMQACNDAGGKADSTLRLLTGIGLTETALSLTSMLHQHAGAVELVLNFGIAGAYPAGKAGLLDICVADEEVLGDLGIGLPERIVRLADRGLSVEDRFLLDPQLRQEAELALQQAGMRCKTGVFVTVNCASGTEQRAMMLGRQFQGLCENMEGAAVARVCGHFGLPCVELRCISNMAGETERSRWRLPEACARAGQAAAAVADFFLRKDAANRHPSGRT
ncbi:Futalosine hydrolase [Candidatus Electronema halotolerans]|jgi:futalosine hydrolase